MVVLEWISTSKILNDTIGSSGVVSLYVAAMAYLVAGLLFFLLSQRHGSGNDDYVELTVKALV